MSNKEILSLRITGRDISIACPPEEKEALIKAANYLNEKIDGIPNKQNNLILAALALAHESLGSTSRDELSDEAVNTIDSFNEQIKKILS
jgi:cell division protein ZapA